MDRFAGHTVTVTFLEWLLQPVSAQLDRIEENQKTLDRKLDDVMAQVRVNQEDLESLDQGLDEATSALSAKIEALNLPEGDLAALREDLDTLRGLSAPPPQSEQPPGTEEQPPLDSGNPSQAPEGEEPQVNPL